MTTWIVTTKVCKQWNLKKMTPQNIEVILSQSNLNYPFIRLSIKWSSVHQ